MELDWTYVYISEQTLIYLAHVFVFMLFVLAYIMCVMYCLFIVIMIIYTIEYTISMNSFTVLRGYYIIKQSTHFIY